MHRNDIDLVECDLTIEQLPKSTLRQLEPDSAQPYQPPRCWLPGEHTGGPKERPQPAAPRTSLQLRSKQRFKPPAKLRIAKDHLQDKHVPGTKSPPTYKYRYTKTQNPCLDAHSEQLSTRRREPLQSRRRTRVRGSGRGDGGLGVGTRTRGAAECEG